MKRSARISMVKGRGQVRRADLLVLGLGLGSLLLGLLFLDACLRNNLSRAHREAGTAAVRGLLLTDLCLFTEARYTRHLSQADLHSAFQDHPLSLEHFPAGSFALPPKKIRFSHEKVD
ncbi:MAG: hypothetical protein A4E57_00175 [Syntrophorhabdaceae bacterium PtaU1.Bin034]|nr:MAG: hypothetical protein A4E57_00175 [Syntrophorhabdaceae bacterium PtaU1.Bin034]